MKLFLLYAAGKWRSILCFFLTAALFFTVFALYRLPLEAVLYAALLALIPLCCFYILDFTAVYKKHRALLRILHAEQLPPSLPAAHGVVEQDYRALLQRQQAVYAAHANETVARSEEMRDYYTLWAHQIKTPIAAMRLILAGNTPPGEAELEKKDLSEQLRRVEQYVEMVLCYMRLDSDAHDLVIREYPLDELLKRVLRDEAPSFIRSRLQLDYTPTAVRVLTDEKWLCFVLGQLLSNALKYTKKGSIRIAWEAPRTLLIADTGIGIAPQDLPRLFEKGYTGNNGRADHRASGIGLYLCRRVLTMLGHTITVESVLQKGTEVRISFCEERLCDY